MEMPVLIASEQVQTCFNSISCLIRLYIILLPVCLIGVISRGYANPPSYKDHHVGRTCCDLSPPLPSRGVLIGPTSMVVLNRLKLVVGNAFTYRILTGSNLF